jgi:hypothetical protein
VLEKKILKRSNTGIMVNYQISQIMLRIVMVYMKISAHAMLKHRRMIR